MNEMTIATRADAEPVAAGPASTREKILAAAAAMLGEDPMAQLSVRAVAARAGISTGSLRHHFPTQRVLKDAVLAGIYRYLAPDDPIHDDALPARDRLVNSLRQILALGGSGDEARAGWAKVYQTYIAAEPSAKAHRAYLDLDRQSVLRVEHWLGVLEAEGALPAGDNARRARFLLTVIDGLSLERVLPSDGSRLGAETDALYYAVDGLLTASASNPAQDSGSRGR